MWLNWMYLQKFIRFHVQLIKRASEDPLPSQKRDDTQPPPVFPNNENSMGENEPEQFVERIMRAEKFRRGRGWVRRVLVKWKNFAEPNWEDPLKFGECSCIR